MPDKVDLLLHPVRMRIITQLINRQMTASDLARAMPEVAQATLYRHIKTLEDAEMIDVVAREQIRGTVEKTYALSEGMGRLSMQDIEGMTPDEHIQLFTLFAMGLISDFGHMMATLPDEDTERALATTRYNKMALYLTDDEVLALREALTTLLQQAANNPASPDRKRYLLTLITLPDTDTQETDA